MRKRPQWTGYLLLLLAVGCGSKLNYETTVQVAPAEERELTIDPTSRDQKVRVVVQSSGVPVNVYCCLEKDRAEAEKAVRTKRPFDKLLLREEKKEEVDQVVEVPANTKAIVLLTSASGKTANAKVKLTN